jgi:CheY-like chemotaxis protein
MSSPSRRVLIVDDDQIVADTLSIIFERSGFEAVACYSADDGLRFARHFRPHLLLCDICMPGRDGLSLVHDISLEMPSCRILVLTGSYSHLSRIQDYTDRLAQEVGLMTKPCPPDDLLRMATQILSAG